MMHSPVIRLSLPPYSLAVPSWVFPATIAQNCAFLAGRVDEVGLVFFETAASLSYTREDFPDILNSHGLRYHIHLPNDLPYADGAETARICLELLGKVEHLGVQRVVLHPPPASFAGAERVLYDFVRVWEQAGKHPADIALENIRTHSLLGLQQVITATGMKICLDLGHMLAYGQHMLVETDWVLDSVAILHLSAPGRGKQPGQHLPLTTLTSEEKKIAKHLCRRVSRDTVMMLELFSWDHIMVSFPQVQLWCDHETPLAR